jgi:hypothetical protein
MGVVSNPSGMCSMAHGAWDELLRAESCELRAASRELGLGARRPWAGAWAWAWAWGCGWGPLGGWGWGRGRGLAGTGTGAGAAAGAGRRAGRGGGPPAVGRDWGGGGASTPDSALRAPRRARALRAPGAWSAKKLPLCPLSFVLCSLLFGLLLATQVARVASDLF